MKIKIYQQIVKILHWNDCSEIRSSVISARGIWEFLVIEKLLSINGQLEWDDMDDDDDGDNDDDDDDDGDDDDDDDDFESF